MPVRVWTDPELAGYPDYLLDEVVRDWTMVPTLLPEDLARTYRVSIPAVIRVLAIASRKGTLSHSYEEGVENVDRQSTTFSTP